MPGPPRFRVRFDVPTQFATEPGYMLATHANDLRLGAGDLVGTVKEPATGLLMLTPSWASDAYYDNGSWTHLGDDWIYDTDFWEEVARGADPDIPASQVARYWTTKSGPSGVNLIPGLAVTSANAIVSLTSAMASDYLIPALQSTFLLAQDEAFVWEYHALGDEKQRNRNWFALQWGGDAGIYLHFSADGHVRAYRYLDGPDAAPTQIDEFQIATPGDIYNKDGYIILQPIPFYGLSVAHSTSAQRLNAFTSSAAAGVSRAHLIELDTLTDEVTGGGYVLEASKLTVSIAVNLLRIQHVFTMHRTRFRSSGTALGQLFDPGYQPTTTPESSSAITLNTAPKYAGSVSATSVVRNANNTANWSLPSDRQGRVLASLGTSDPVYTPFVLGLGARFLPVFTTRGTTAKDPDTLLGLEFTEDDEGRFEGSCMVLMQSEENRELVERGDTTFVVEVTEDDGATWSTACNGKAGGIARIDGDVQMLYASGGLYYVAKWSLHDLFYARCAEVHQFGQTAFDSLSVGDAVNTVLFCSALALISPSSMPSRWSSETVPPVPQGQNWRFAPRPGDDGVDIVRDLLLILRRQWEEWYLYWDWDAEEWVPEQKPHNTSDAATWTFTPWSDEVSSGGVPIPRTVLVGEENLFGVFRPIPPECNIVQAYGITSTEASKGKRVVSTPLFNRPSIADPDSVDYLGRCVAVRPKFDALQDLDGPAGLNTMALRVYDASAHRRMKAVYTSWDYKPTLRPSTQIQVRSESASRERMDWMKFWLRSISVVADYTRAGDQAPMVRYHLDERWEGDID